MILARGPQAKLPQYFSYALFGCPVPMCTPDMQSCWQLGLVGTQAEAGDEQSWYTGHWQLGLIPGLGYPG